MTPSSLLRLTSVVEALTWAFLLTAMLCKYVLAPEAGRILVPVAGAAHATGFLAYLLAVLAVAVHGRWAARPVIVGVLASIAPFTTLLFDWWAERRGLVRDSWDAVPATDGHVPVPFPKRFGGLAPWIRTHPITLGAIALTSFLFILTPALSAALRA